MFAYAIVNTVTSATFTVAAGTTIGRLTYLYDNAGDRVGRKELDGSRVTWTYDKQNQLLTENRTGTNPYRQTYTYDPAGNRTLKNVDKTLARRMLTMQPTNRNTDRSLRAERLISAMPLAISNWKNPPRASERRSPGTLRISRCFTKNLWGFG